MADPALAASVLPAPGDGFDILSFLRNCGTVYLIAEATGEDAPVAPLFAAMATEIHHLAALAGQASTSGRLDPPLLMGLDEVTQICPVPLPAWLSDSGGKGIQVIAVAHGGGAQLASRWDDHGRQVIWDTSSVKVFLPGITDTTTLQAASTLCGQASWKIHGQDHPGHFDIATPDMIRQLPSGFALVIRGGLAPVIARLPRAWNNLAYRRAFRRRGPGPGPSVPRCPPEPEPGAGALAVAAGAGERHVPRLPATRLGDRERRPLVRRQPLLPLELTMTTPTHFPQCWTNSPPPASTSHSSTLARPPTTPNWPASERSWLAWSPRSAGPWPTTPPPSPAWTPSTGKSVTSPAGWPGPATATPGRKASGRGRRPPGGNSPATSGRPRSRSCAAGPSTYTGPATATSPPRALGDPGIERYIVHSRGGGGSAHSAPAHQRRRELRPRRCNDVRSSRALENLPGEIDLYRE